jgi:AcrR family transcriptional regulator
LSHDPLLSRVGRVWTRPGAGLIIPIIRKPDQLTDSASTRDRLLEAAAAVIARDGYQGARLADVAREAGLTTGAIYSNFRDKEELFLAAFERIQQLDQALLRGGAELSALVASAPAAIAHLAESSQLQILNLELALLGARDEKVHALLKRDIERSIAAVAARLPSSLPQREARAALIISLLNGFALMRMMGGEAVTTELLPDELRRLIGQAGD